MDKFYYLFLVLLSWSDNSNQSECNEEGSNNVLCSTPSDALKVLNNREVSSDVTYTCTDDFIDFTCTQEGRFPDLADTTCKWYFECIKDKRGVLIQKYAQCTTSPFSPTLQNCSSIYKCPCDMITTLPPTPDPDWWCTDATLPTFKCETSGRFPDLRDNSCRQYFLCSKFHNGTWSKTSYSCKDSVFDPLIGKCDTTYICPCIIPSTTTSKTTTTIAQITKSTSEYLCNSNLPNYVSNFRCSLVGRFPDLGDIECRRYFLCSQLRNGTWVKTRYSCIGSTFDPDIKKCNINHKCPCDQSTTDPPTTTSETTTTSTEVTDTTIAPTTTSDYACNSNLTNYVPNFHCTVSGRYPDLSDFECKKYFLCSKLRNETWVKTMYSCIGSTFDPNIQTCSTYHQCPCENTTPVSSTSTTPSSISTNTTSTNYETTTITTAINPHPCSPIDTFECISVGRFPDLSDFQCEKYFLCSRYKNGTFVKNNYKCIGSTFDPSIRKCSVAYPCACTPQPTTSSPDSTSRSSQLTTTSIRSTALSSTSTAYTCAPPSESLPHFSCTRVGRFPDLADPNCKTYFLCSTLRGSWIQTRYSCKSSTFHPVIEKCDVAYPCPCLTYYTTPFLEN